MGNAAVAGVASIEREMRVGEKDRAGHAPFACLATKQGADRKSVRVRATSSPDAAAGSKERVARDKEKEQARKLFTFSKNFR